MHLPISTFKATTLAAVDRTPVLQGVGTKEVPNGFEYYRTASFRERIRVNRRLNSLLQLSNARSQFVFHRGAIALVRAGGWRGCRSPRRTSLIAAQRDKWDGREPRGGREWRDPIASPITVRRIPCQKSARRCRPRFRPLPSSRRSPARAEFDCQYPERCREFKPEIIQNRCTLSAAGQS